MLCYRQDGQEHGARIMSMFHQILTQDAQAILGADVTPEEMHQYNALVFDELQKLHLDVIYTVQASFNGRDTLPMDDELYKAVHNAFLRWQRHETINIEKQEKLQRVLARMDAVLRDMQHAQEIEEILTIFYVVNSTPTVWRMWNNAQEESVRLRNEYLALQIDYHHMKEPYNKLWEQISVEKERMVHRG